VAWVLVRLKARLLRNGIGGDTARQIALAGAIVGGGMAAFFGFLALVSVRLDAKWGPPLAVVACAALLGGWLLFPVLGFGSDETLDPAKLALLPIPRRSLMAGLLGAGLVGVPPLATAIALSGAVIGYAGGPGTPIVLAVAAAFLLVCVAGSRAVVTVLAPALRSRRGRDLAVLGATLAGLSFYLLQLLLPRGDSDPNATLRRLESSARVLRRTPFGWAGDAFVAAGSGRYGTALLELGGLLALGALLVWLWAVSLDRAMTTAAATTADAGPESGGELAPRAFRRLLPGGRLGAVAARELRYYVREPRRRAQMFGMTAFALVMPLVGLRGSLAGARPFGLLYPSVMLGFSTANQIGLDGPAWWLHIVTGRSGRTDLAGKNLAATIVALPVLAVASVALVVLGAPGLRVLTLYGVAVGGLGISLGFANVASVRAAYPMPESTTNPWATGGNQGCAAVGYGFVALVGSGLLLTPSIVLVAVGHGRAAFAVPALVLALGIGLGAWWTGLTLAGRDLDRRGPELLAVIDPRRA
jgi:ABC-2 type transport system permease protein